MSIDKSQLQHRLTPEAFYVTQQKGTERPFTGEFNDHWEAGDYHCICCDARLFTQAHKFDAGCGWPSFFEQTDDSNVVFREDHSHGVFQDFLMLTLQEIGLVLTLMYVER